MVWYSFWQMECCGTSFAVGDQVTWTVEADVRAIADDDWLVDALGPETARRIAHAEEHHPENDDDVRGMIGRVLSLTEAWGAMGPARPQDRLHVPVAGSERFNEAHSTLDVDRMAAPTLGFHGWIVELGVFSGGDGMPSARGEPRPTGSGLSWVSRARGGS